MYFAGAGVINDNNNNISGIFFNSTGTINNNGTYGQVLMNGSGVITGNNTFGTLEFTGGNQYTLTSGKTQIIQNDLVANGNCSAPVAILSSSTTVQTNLSKDSGTVTINKTSLQGINATGGATFIANNSVDLGNNTGWTINPVSVQDLYWVGGSGNWNDVNHWAAESGGAGGYCVPTQSDNVLFDENSFTQTSQAVFVNVTEAGCRNMDWSGAAFGPTFTALSNAYILHVYGSFTIIPEMNFAFSGKVYFEGGNPGKSFYTVTMSGKSFGNDIHFYGDGGIWVLQDALNLGIFDLYLDFGTLNSNSQTVSCRQFNSSNNNQRAIIMGSSVLNISFNGLSSWNVTGNNFTITPETSEIRIIATGGNFLSTGLSNLTYNQVLFQNPGGNSILNSDDTFNSVIFNGEGKIDGSGSYNNVIFTGDGETDGTNLFGTVAFMNDGIINGTNSFSTLTFTAGKTFLAKSGNTQTIIDDLVFSGTVDNPIYFQSTTDGIQATFYKASGLVEGNFVRLKDMSATGNAVFNLYSSLDLGNNTGWNFLEPAAPICPDDMEVCLNAEPFVLSAALPLGGEYSGPGVSGNIFSPAVVGIGIHTITYTYTDPGTGHTDFCTFLIIVKALPVVTCPTYPDPVCLNTDPFVLTGGSPAGEGYTGPGVIGGIFSPSVAGTGIHTITYTYTDPTTGCSDYCTFTITVIPLPVVTCPTYPDEVCSNSTPFALAGGNPAGGIYTGPGVSSNIFSPAIAGAGNQTITYTYTDPGTGCSNSCSFVISVIKCCQDINLLTGTQFISTYINPVDVNFKNIMTPVLTCMKLAKNSVGKTLAKVGPNWVNQIGNWISTEGYIVTMNCPATLTICGTPPPRIPCNTPIPVSGTKIVPFLSTVPINASTAFNNIKPNLKLVKNTVGKTLAKVGPNWVNQIGNCNPGEGYLVTMNAPDVLVYPCTDEGGSTYKNDVIKNHRIESKHFEWIGGNAAENTWTMYISLARIGGVGLEPGDELAVLDGEKIVGVETLTESPVPGAFNVSLIAFNVLGDLSEGYQASHPITIKLWDQSTFLEYSDCIIDFFDPYGDSWTRAIFPAGNNFYSIAEINVIRGESKDIQSFVDGKAMIFADFTDLLMDVTYINFKPLIWPVDLNNQAVLRRIPY